MVAQKPAPQGRSLKHSLRISAALFALFATLFFGLGVAQAQAPQVQLSFDSEPPGAQVIVNGRRLGITPFELSMSEGSTLEIRVELAGFEPYSQTLTLDQGSPVEVRVVLEQEASTADP